MKNRLGAFSYMYPAVDNELNMATFSLLVEVSTFDIFDEHKLQ